MGASGELYCLGWGILHNSSLCPKVGPRSGEEMGPRSGGEMDQPLINLLWDMERDRSVNLGEVRELTKVTLGNGQGGIRRQRSQKADPSSPGMGATECHVNPRPMDMAWGHLLRTG